MENTKRLSYDNAPTCGTIKGNIEIFRNRYGSDDILTLCCIKVTLLDADNQWMAEEHTDDNGDFAFLGVPLKAYTVVFPESIDYRRQKFLSENKGFQHQFKVDLTPEKTRVTDIRIRYGLTQTGLIESYVPETNTQPLLGVKA